MKGGTLRRAPPVNRYLLFVPLVLLFCNGVKNALSTLVAAPKTARRAAGTLSGPATFTSCCFRFEFEYAPLRSVSSYCGFAFFCSVLPFLSVIKLLLLNESRQLRLPSILFAELNLGQTFSMLQVELKIRHAGPTIGKGPAHVGSWPHVFLFRRFGFALPRLAALEYVQGLTTGRGP